MELYLCLILLDLAYLYLSQMGITFLDKSTIFSVIYSYSSMDGIIE